MNNKTASTRTEGLLSLFDMHTNFFERALEGMSDEDMYKRLDTKANHMAWLAGSMVAQRYVMASEVNPDAEQTGGELFKDNKGIQDDTRYPTIAEYIADWKKITPSAREGLMKLDDQKLDSDLDMGDMKMTWYEMVSFTMYREASMIGQLALWRRLLDYPALRYD